MAKRAKPEEIIAKLREAEVRLSQGESVAMAAKSIGVTEQTYYRWRKEYGGLQVNQAKRLKEMEKENARLRKAISDLMLDKQILEEVIEGLRVPQKQPKRGRLWLNDGSCFRLRPAHKGHVWSYDFVQDRTHEGKVFRMLCIIDEFTRECLAIRVERRLNSRDVLDELGELFVRHGPPEHIRSDNGPEFIATALREWLGRLGTKTLYIEPGSPWENGYCESFNSKLRDELLAREIFYDLREAKALIEGWRIHYNTYRPHSSLGYKPPAPVTVLPASFIPPYRGRAA